MRIAIVGAELLPRARRPAPPRHGHLPPRRHRPRLPRGVHRRHGSARLRARLRRALLQPDRGLRHLRLPGEPRRRLRPARLRLRLDQAPPPRRLRRGAAEQPAHGLLRPRAARPRRARAQRARAPDRRAPQRLGLHPGARRAERGRPGATPRLAHGARIVGGNGGSAGQDAAGLGTVAQAGLRRRRESPAALGRFHRAGARRRTGGRARNACASPADPTASRPTAGTRDPPRRSARSAGPDHAAPIGGCGRSGPPRRTRPPLAGAGYRAGAPLARLAAPPASTAPRWSGWPARTPSAASASTAAPRCGRRPPPSRRPRFPPPTSTNPPPCCRPPPPASRRCWTTPTPASPCATTRSRCCGRAWRRRACPTPAH